MKKAENLKHKKLKEIDTSSFVTGPSEYDTSDGIHVITRGAQKSSESCGLCIDIFPINDVITVSKCKHSFCEDCFKVYLAKTIQEDIHQVKCPGSKCKVELAMDGCAKFIPEHVFDRWKSSLTEASALEEYKMIMCPFNDCSGVFTDDGKRYLIRACPECCKLFCSRCMVEWHENINCAMFQRSRRYEFGSRRSNSYFLRRYNY